MCVERDRLVLAGGAENNRGTTKAMWTDRAALVEHPCQQLFSGNGRNTRTLQVTNFSALPVDLAAPMFDFSAHGGELH
jgi:hypothetical protein